MSRREGVAYWVSRCVKNPGLLFESTQIPQDIKLHVWNGTVKFLGIEIAKIRGANAEDSRVKRLEKLYSLPVKIRAAVRSEVEIIFEGRQSQKRPK